MPRPLRTDYPGATHHVYVRGVNRSAVAVDEDDYLRVLGLLERVVSRFDIQCHAWCFLPNHSHLLLTSREGNVSKAMQWLGSCTARTFNDRHERSGHLYQGRFGSKLVEDDGYFLELARYVALNPARAGLCEAPADWPWSSYRATAGLQPRPRYLDSGVVVGLLGSESAYVEWVANGLDHLPLDEHGVPPPPPRPTLDELLPVDSDRAIALAHFRYGYSRIAIAQHLGVGRWQIGRRLALLA
ncbi:MAG: REP-associated tyrosine transposase [Gaiellales bacterium]|jgi:putative transposase|nr:REP-associated tyrosine transposase [Gaiellales bacterium]